MYGERVQKRSHFFRGHSSAGRALRSQRRGRGFESHWLHEEKDGLFYRPSFFSYLQMPVTHASAVRKQRAFAMVGHPVDVRRARFRRAIRGGAPDEVVGSNPIGSMRKSSCNPLSFRLSFSLKAE